MTQTGDNKLVHHLPVKSVLFKNEKDENVGVRRRNFPRDRGPKRFYKCVHGICNNSQLERMFIVK